MVARTVIALILEYGSELINAEAADALSQHLARQA